MHQERVASGCHRRQARFHSGIRVPIFEGLHHPALGHRVGRYQMFDSQRLHGDVQGHAEGSEGREKAQLSIRGAHTGQQQRADRGCRQGKAGAGRLRRRFASAGLLTDSLEARCHAAARITCALANRSPSPPGQSSVSSRLKPDATSCAIPAIANSSPVLTFAAVISQLLSITMAGAGLFARRMLSMAVCTISKEGASSDVAA